MVDECGRAAWTVGPPCRSLICGLVESDGGEVDGAPADIMGISDLAFGLGLRRGPVLSIYDGLAHFPAWRQHSRQAVMCSSDSSTGDGCAGEWPSQRRFAAQGGALVAKKSREYVGRWGA